MMKRSIVVTAVLSALFMSAGTFAAETDYGELIITGKVVGTTCKFVGETTARIDMNQVGMDRLNSLSAGGVYEGYTNKTTAPLKVKCTGTEAPRITFSSSQFDSTHNNITRNTASDNGVGFAVYHGETLIKPTEVIELTKTDTGEYELEFSARYANLLGTNAVRAGEVSSSLTLTVVTD